MSKSSSSDLRQMKMKIIEFSDKRNWNNHHTPKNLAMDIIREASELLEHFIWETNTEIRKDKKRHVEIADEMGDVLHALLLLSHELKIDLPTAFWAKLKKTEKKYPIDKIKNSSGYTYKRQLKARGVKK